MPAAEPAPDRAERRFAGARVLATVAGILAVGLALWPGGRAWGAPGGELEISVIDRETGKPIACRMHLKHTNTGKAVKPPGVPALGDHFVFYDKIVLKLPVGGYTFVMERGPEYLTRTGNFRIENFAKDRKTIDLKRFVDMAKEGWYAGDLDVQRGEREIPLLMEAEDLYVTSLVSWTNGRNEWGKRKAPAEPVLRLEGPRFCSLMGGLDARGGNGLGMYRLGGPLPLPPLAAGGNANEPSLLLATAARREGGWVDAVFPFSRDLPLWVGAGKLDSVQIANRHLLREGVVDHEAGGKRRDLALFPNLTGNGRWSTHIYYQLLECGLRLPPTAGSGSGAVARGGGAGTGSGGTGSGGAVKGGREGTPANVNPVGYNRMYVQVDGEFTWDKWWEGLKGGRVVVGNGPLMRPQVEGQAPGYVFHGDPGKTLELEIGLTLSTRERIAYLEIIKNGRVEHEVRLDKFQQDGGRLPPVKFTESGWFLVRAVTDEQKTYRFACTGPYYVEFSYQPRISRRAVQFFLDWVREQRKEAEQSLAQDGGRSGEYLAKGEAYWQRLLEKANAD